MAGEQWQFCQVYWALLYPVMPHINYTPQTMEDTTTITSTSIATTTTTTTTITTKATTKLHDKHNHR